MKNTKFPNSLRKRIRDEKARIRKEIATPKQAKVEIEGIYRKITSKKKDDDKGDI